GFSGQKCSACSRVIAVEDIYDDLLERVQKATEALTVGDASDYNNFMGPVIDEKALKKIKSYLKVGEDEGR
ncbi:aldehyde dehydrogenase family protein, partial [Klebsiella pneumoniae]|nr:aldehyde dehydrogenase family protein [Klebsiella pneumoniae]MCP6594613.1 aldehyde dehydrogenase family protein [Klebsiella pneumoniae]